MYKKTLETTFQGKDYVITHEIAGWSGKNTVTINGEVVQGLGKGYNPYGETRFPIQLDGQDVQLIVFGKDLKIASGENMVAAANPEQKIIKGKKPPWWAYIFIVFCAILLVSGGALGGGLGAASGFFCLTFSNKREKSTTVRVLACLGVTIAAWVLYLVVGALLFA